MPSGRNHPVILKIDFKFSLLGIILPFDLTLFLLCSAGFAQNKLDLL